MDIRKIAKDVHAVCAFSLVSLVVVMWYNKNSFISKRHHFGIFGLWIWFLELISNILFSLDHVKIINLPLCQ